jgi:hypothetical protein
VADAQSTRAVRAVVEAAPCLTREQVRTVAYLLGLRRGDGADHASGKTAANEPKEGGSGQFRHEIAWLAYYLYTFTLASVFP